MVELGEPDACGGSPMRRFVEIDGKRYLWRDVLKLRREQREEYRRPQLALFELKEDRRSAIDDSPVGSGCELQPQPGTTDDR